MGRESACGDSGTKKDKIQLSHLLWRKYLIVETEENTEKNLWTQFHSCIARKGQIGEQFEDVGSIYTVLEQLPSEHSRNLEARIRAFVIKLLLIAIST